MRGRKKPLEIVTKRHLAGLGLVLREDEVHALSEHLLAQSKQLSTERLELESFDVSRRAWQKRCK
jgi:hypothetical protein